MTAFSKEETRKLCLERRLGLDADKHQEMSVAVQERVIKSGLLPKSGNIGLYSAVKNEVQTGRLFQYALEHGLHVYFPRVEQGIRFYEVNGPDELKRGSWNILEPGPECEELAADRSLDAIFIPGIAFTRTGHRIGYGRGFYDIYLSGLKVPVTSIGLAFEFQIIDDFPVEEGDRLLSLIVTEKNSYKASGTEKTAKDS